MKYRNAHWWLIGLLPLIVLAFWPGYFSQMRGASIGHHLHGAAGTLWILLAAFQSWTIANRRIALHRAAGRGVYFVIPLFVLGGTLAIFEMANGYLNAVDPFRQTFGARLALLDISAVIAVPILVRDALGNRRRIGRHSASMLATVLFILPPMFGRLFPLVPGFPHGFSPACYAGEILGAAIAAGLWLRDRHDGAPFLVVAMLNVADCFAFANFSGDGLVRSVADLSSIPTAALAAGLAALLLIVGGKPVQPHARQPAPTLS